MSSTPLDFARAPSDERRFDASPRDDRATGLSLHVSPLPHPSPGTVARARLDAGHALEPIAEAWLQPAEQLWWDGLPDLRQADALLGIVALREALRAGGWSEREGAKPVTILHHAGSPPRVSGDPGLHCSVAHERAAAVAAVARDPIGVDLVGRDHFDDSVLERIASPGEAEAMRAVGVPAREIPSLLWAAKEAVLKGVGLGLGLHPSRVVVQPAMDLSWRAELPALFQHPRHWRIDLEAWENRWMAVARPDAESAG